MRFVFHAEFIVEKEPEPEHRDTESDTERGDPVGFSPNA